MAAAQDGDADAFERLAAAYRGPLHAHCYRMLGSLQDGQIAEMNAFLDPATHRWFGLAEELVDEEKKSVEER